eukprot:SAG31_NODE_4285_length_3381_cov_1.637112_3_plen_63_part_00
MYIVRVRGVCLTAERQAGEESGRYIEIWKLSSRFQYIFQAEEKSGRYLPFPVVLNLAWPYYL